MSRQSVRVLRVQSQINKLLNECLQREIRNEQIKQLVFLETIITPDLGNATVWYQQTNIGSVADEKTTPLNEKDLQKCAGVFGRYLGKKLNLVRVPKLHFKLDKSAEHAQRIDELLALKPAASEDNE